MTHWVRAVLNDACKKETQLHGAVSAGLQRIVEIVEKSSEFQFLSKSASKTADELSVCDNLGDLARLLWTFAVDNGFQHFSLFLINQGQARAYSSRLCTSLPSEWLSQYQKKSYQYMDPVFAQAEREDGAFLFSDSDDCAPIARDYWSDAKKHKIGGNGLCLANTNQSGTRVAVAFYTNRDARSTADYCRLNGYDLRTVAQLAIECYWQVAAGVTQEPENLSEKELRFLHMLATSPKPQAAMSQLSQYGGNRALQESIRRKMGVETIFQAISIASALRWFDELPYYEEEVVVPFPGLAGWEITG